MKKMLLGRANQAKNQRTHSYTVWTVAMLVVGLGLLAVPAAVAQSTVVETWTGVTLTGSSYGGGNATGVLGSWAYLDTRWDQTLNGKAPCVRSGSLQIANLAGGCSKVVFSYKWPYSEKNSQSIDLYLNNVKVKTITYTPSQNGTGTMTFDGFTPVTGLVILKLQKNGSDRMVIDDITITGASSGTAPVWTSASIDQSITVDDGVMLTMTDYLTTPGTPAPSITVISVGANTPVGHYEMDGNDFYFEPTAADAGKSFTFRFTASNASGTPTKDMTVNVAAGCTPDQVVLIQQTEHYDATWSSGGGAFNQGTTEMGMWANTGSKQTVAWRNFRTQGTKSGDLRPLLPGDRFRISVHGYSPVGGLGVSLNDGAATGSWDNRLSNSRASIRTDNYGDLYVTSAGGSSAWSGIRPWDTTVTMEFIIQSTKEFSANIVGQTAKVDLSMSGAPGNTDFIDGFSVFYNDDWNGTANANLYWKQETSVTNLGYVTFGEDNGTRTIQGRVMDGNSPACPDTPSPNKLVKKGTGTITLSDTANTYSDSTYIDAGTLIPTAAGSLGVGESIYLGAESGSASATLQLNSAMTLAKDIEARSSSTGTKTILANESVTLSGDVTATGPLTLNVAATKAMTISGTLAGGAAWTKAGTGSLVLNTANTWSGAVAVNAGTVVVGHASALGGTSGAAISLANGTTLELNVSAAARSLTMASGSTLKLVAGRVLTVGAASSIANVSIDLTGQTINENERKTWALTSGGTPSIVSGATVSTTGAGSLAGTFSLGVEGGAAVVIYTPPPKPIVILTPTSFSFTDVTCGDTATRTFTIQNTGNAVLNITSLSVTGTGFALVGSAPTSVGIGESETFTVSFTPPDAGGTYSGGISIVNNSLVSPVTATLSGSSPCFSAMSTITAEAGATSFELTWPPVPGATTYYLDVSDYEDFEVAGGGVGGLFISQYYEGTSNNKWLELYNASNADIDLSTYRIGLWINAAREGWKTGATPGTTITLSGTIAAGETFLIKNTSATLPSYASANLSSGSLTFTGDDSVVLFTGTYSTANIIDAIGLTTNTLQDTSLVRISSIRSGNTAVANMVASEWTTFSNANVDSAATSSASRLGFHIVDPGTIPSFVGIYSNLVVSSPTTVTGLSVNETYYYRILASNANCTAVMSPVGTVTTVSSVADITISPTTLNFGAVEIDSYADLTLTAQNFGQSSGAVTWPTLPTGVTYVGTPPTTVAASATVTATLRYSPTDLSPLSGTITVTHAGGTGSTGVSLIGLPYDEPIVTLSAVSGLSTTGATLNGTVNPQNAETLWWFEYGLTDAFGTSTAGGTVPVGTSAQTVSSSLTGLQPNTTYYYCLYALNDADGVSTTTNSFTTLAQKPAVVTLAATSVGETAMTLNGTVNAYNAASDVWFVYGTASDALTSKATVATPVTGNTVTPVSTALSDLQACQTYYFAVVASNSAGAVTGSVQSAETAQISAPVLTDPPISVTANSFTASWNEISSATSYLLDVSLYETFAVGSGIVTSINENIQSWASRTGYSTSTIEQLGSGGTWQYISCIISPSGSANGVGSIGVIQLQAQNAVVIFPSIDQPQEVSINARGSNAISLQRYDGTSWVTLTNWTLVTSGTRFTYSLNSSDSDVQLRIVKTTSSAGYIHDIIVTADTSTPDFLPGYENKTVSTTNETISGLTSGETYYYRVRSVGNCTSAYSAVESVTIPFDPPVWTTIPNQTVILGNTAEVDLVATGIPTPVYSHVSVAPALAGTPSVVDNEDGTATWTYTPVAADVGKTVTVTVQASNSGGDVTTTFQLTILEAPAWNGTGASVPAITGEEYTLNLGTYMQTLGSPTATYSLVSRVPTVDYSLTAGTGAFSFFPATDGTYVFTFRLQNTAGYTDFVLTVESVDDCSYDEVVLTQQTDYYTVQDFYGNVFNSGATDLGMWANGNADSKVVAWREFRTSGSSEPGNPSGVARALQPGDRFRISLQGESSVEGEVGVALLDGIDSTSWDTRRTNARTYLQSVNYGDFFVGDANGTPSWSNIKLGTTQLTFEFYILSSKEFTVNILGQTPKYEMTMFDNPGDDDRIDGFSLYYSKGWDGSGNRNVYWKQEAAVTNLGYVELGLGNDTKNISGKITDASSAKCATLPSANLVVKKGTGTITLGHAANTYSGGTYIDSGTLVPAYQGSLGSGGVFIGPESGTPAAAPVFRINSDMTLTNEVTIRNGSGIRTFYINADVIHTADLKLQEVDVSGAIVQVASGKTLTQNGLVSGVGHLRKTAAGTLWLNGDNSFTGGMSINGGTVVAGHTNALGGSGNAVTANSSGTLRLLTSVNVRSLTMASGSTLALSAGMTVTESEASTIANVVFDVSADESFDGSSEELWLITEGGMSSLASGATVTPVNAPVGATGLFSLEVEEGHVIVHYIPRPAAPLLVAGDTTATTILLDALADEDSHTVVIVYNTTGDFDPPPAHGTGVPLEDSTFGGGTVAYADPSSDFIEVDDLASCTLYYFKAWAVDRGVWSADDEDEYDRDSATTGTPDAPINLYVDPTNATSFVLNWDAVPGATGYRLDVSTNANFSSGTPLTTVLEEDFSLVSVGVNTAITPNTDLHVSGWTATAVYGGSGTIRVGAGSTKGILTTPTRDLSANNGNATLSFDAWNYGSDSTTVIVSLSINGGISWVPVLTQSLTGSMVTYTVALTGGTTTSQVKIEGQGASSQRFYLDNFKIIQGGDYVDDYVTSYSNAPVGNVSSVLVSGLEEETTYYFRLRTEGTTCVSENSETGSVTTIYDPTIPDVTLSDNGTQVAANHVLVGAANHVLHQSQLTVSLPVGAELEWTGLSFTTAGTALATDLTNLKVWTSDSSTFNAVSAFTLGSLTPNANGEYALTGFTVTEAIDDAVIYVYITADVAADAIGGRTISVPALTSASFTFTEGRKTGTTTDGGVQTIWRAPDLALATSSTDIAAGTTGTVDISAGTGVYPASVTYTISLADGSPTPSSMPTATNGIPNSTFAFTPTSADAGKTFVFLIIGANEAGTSTAVSLTVTVGMSPLASFTVTPLGADSIQLNFTPFQTGDDVVIRYSTVESDLSSPTSGGTVAYSGSADSSPQVLTGLLACQTYYFAAWEEYNSVYSVTPLTASGTTLPPAATTRLWASVTNANDFTASWEPIPGAVSYRLDVSTDANFGEGSEYRVKEGFDSAPTAPDEWTFSGTAGSYISTGNYGAAAPSLQMNANCHTITTPTFSNPTNLSFWLKGQGAGASTVTVEQLIGGTWSPALIISSIPTIGTITNCTLDSAATQARIVFARTAGNLSIDDVIIMGEVPTSAFVPGYENLTVNGTSQSVTGLTDDTLYYFRVKAVGVTGEACSGPYTADSVLTLEGLPSPDGVQASDGTYWDKVTVTWQQRTGATGYSIWRSETTNTAGAVEIGTVTGGNITSFDDVGTVGGLELAKVYYYWVRSTATDYISKLRLPDPGHAGSILRYTGFEGAQGESWTFPEAEDDPISRLKYTADSTQLVNLHGAYSLRLNPGDRFELDATDLPIGANATLKFLYAADGPDASDDLILHLSYDDGVTWTPATVAAGGGNLEIGFTLHTEALPAGSTSVRVAFEFSPSANSNDKGYYYIDEVQLVASASLPQVSFANAASAWVEGTDTLVTIPVSISSAADASVTLQLTGNATPGVDYTISTTNVQFSASGPTTVDVEITLIDDEVAEGTEVIRLTLLDAKGSVVGSEAHHRLVVRDNDSMAIVSAELSSKNPDGEGYLYSAESRRILKTLKPDVATLQLWVLPDGETHTSFVADVFGSEFSFVADAGSDPNGIVSRWPILTSGTWADPVWPDTYFTWARIDLPNNKSENDLVVISAWFTSGDSSERLQQAQTIANQIADAYASNIFLPSDYLVVAGNLNMDSHEDAALTALGAYVSNLNKPTDWSGQTNTDVGGSYPLDFILPNELLELQFEALSYRDRTHTGGLIFDSREWGGHPLPAYADDSIASGMASRAVMKVFALSEVIEDPELEITDLYSPIEIEWDMTANSSGDGMILVYNTSGEFTRPLAGIPPPMAGSSFAGGTVLWVGEAASTNEFHQNLLGCQTYYYRAFSYTPEYIYSPGVTVVGQTATALPPTTHWVNPTNAVDFLMNWTEQPNNGVAYYEVDVALTDLSVAGETEVLNATLLSSVPSGWSRSGYTTNTAAGLRLASGSQAGSVSTPSMNLLYAGGEATLFFRAVGADASTVTVTMFTNGASSGKTVYSASLAKGETRDIELSLVDCTADTVLQFSAASGKRWVLSNVRVTQEVVPERIPGYESLHVTGSSLLVTGLVQNTCYYYRLRAVGGDPSCASDWLFGGPICTEGAPQIATIPTELNFGLVDKSATSNLTLVVTNFGSATLSVTDMHFEGAGAAYFSVVPTTLTILPGESAPVVVTFQPQAGGQFVVDLVLSNNTPDQPAYSVPVQGRCYDPETALPTLYAYSVMDGQGITNVVTDHALANGQAELSATLYHYTGMDTTVGAATFDILNPSGELLPGLANVPFSSVANVMVGTRASQCFTATIPGFVPAELGEYTVRISAKSVNGFEIVDAIRFTPNATGWLFEDFNREDARGAQIGNGWTVHASSGIPSEAAIADGRLTLYGTGSGKQSGRISVWQDVSAVAYSTIWANNASTLSWGFHYAANRATATFSANQYAGAFILGSTDAGWGGGTGQGYAVALTNNSVQLVKFSAGLTANANVTPLGAAYELSANNAAVAVRVDFVPGDADVAPILRLYVREVGNGAATINGGSPLEGHAALPVATIDITDSLPQLDLKYVGTMWNHGSADASDVTAAVFDNFYFPNAGQGIPMTFVVVDEDVEPPVHSNFNLVGAWNIDDIASGLNVVGYVADANGVYATSNKWTLLHSNLVVATGFMTMTPASDGAGTPDDPAMLTTTLAQNLFVADTPEPYIFRIESTDFDVDRTDDALTTTSDYKFYITTARLRTPENVTAKADGEEMVVMRWYNEGQHVVILWSPNELNAASVQLEPMQDYVMGGNGPVDGSKIVYVGGGADREIIVPPGTSNHFLVFGVADKVYSPGVAPTEDVPAVSEEYEPGEIVDSFAYITPVVPGNEADPASWAVPFNDSTYTPRPETGNGWDGPWTGDISAWKIHDVSLLTGVSGYPDAVANKLYWQDTSTSTAADVALTRKLKNENSGRIFVAFLMNYQYSGEEKYVHVSLMSGANADTEVVSFGKQWDFEKSAAITIPGGSPATSAGVSSGTYAGAGDHYLLTPGEGSDYAIVGEWNPSEGLFKMYAYHHSEEIPQVYDDAIPLVTVSCSSPNAIPPITGIRLSAGSSGTTDCELGHVYFDEIRVGRTWDETLLFNFPEVASYVVGESYMEGTNLIYRVSDGQLAEVDKFFDVSFQLHHRTGIKDAEFTFLDNNSTNWLFNPMIALDSTSTLDYSVWTSRVEGVQVDTNRINLGVYTSMVWIVAQGGKETTTVQASDLGAGATDLFFGEFGEGAGWDKYVEIYNGTGGPIDLSGYLIASQTKPEQKWVSWTNVFRLSTNSLILEHGTTILLLNGETQNQGTANLNSMKALLDQAGRDYIVTTNTVLSVSGDDPIGLFRNESFATGEWLDICGLAEETFKALGIDNSDDWERYIMQRKENATVPLPYPDQIVETDWDFRRWSLRNGEQDISVGYTNFLATAGAYDRAVGLSGYMKFHVYDDDIEPPVMGTNSAFMLKIGDGETDDDYKALLPIPGETEVVIAGWSFTNNTDGVESAKQPWPGGLVTNASISWSTAYTEDIINPDGSGTKENSLFGTVEHNARGNIYLKASSIVPNDVDAGMWIQFQIDLVKAHDMIFSFAEAGGSAGFKEAQLLISRTGADGSWEVVDSWVPQTGGTGVFETRSFDLSAVSAGTGMLYLRMTLAEPGSSGSYYMDNIQLTGYPEEFVITDAELKHYGLHFRGNIYDTNSGIQRATARMKVNDKSGTYASAKNVGDGWDTNSMTWWGLPGLSPAEITEWYNISQNDVLPIRINIFDDDKDRINDATELAGHLGNLRVIDDDADRPQLKLDTLRPVGGGVLAQWAFTNNVSRLPTKTDASVMVSAIGTMTENGTQSMPKFSAYDESKQTWAVYHSGWNHDTKYWYATFTPEVPTSITNLSFQSKMGSTNSPTGFMVQVVTPDGEGGVTTNTITTEALTDVAWTTDTIKQWTTHSVTLENLTLAAGQEVEIRLLGIGGNKKKGIGATWYLYDLTFDGEPQNPEGRTEVTDKELAEGGYVFQGNLWDEDSGIISPTFANEAKRPKFSLQRPGKQAYMTDVLLNFTGDVQDGGAKTQAAGAFQNPLRALPYLERDLGEYAGYITAWDADDDRDDDDLELSGAIAFYVIDDDVTDPGAVGTVAVNGVPVPETPPTRETAVWTNNPEFLITFDTPAEDIEPVNELIPLKSRAVTGIGEYRIAATLGESVSSTIRAALGKPYPAAVTNGALANYGFEMWGDPSWDLGEGTAYYNGDTANVWEGTNSLVIHGTSFRASQTLKFSNTAGNIPTAEINLHHKGGAIDVIIEAFDADTGTSLGLKTCSIPASSDAWQLISHDFEGIGDAMADMLVVTLVGRNGSTAAYIDNVRLSVDIGEGNKPAMRFLAREENQGINAQYVYAVDADNDRIGDRRAGPAKPFYVAFDMTPPPALTQKDNELKGTDEVDDPASMIGLTWNTTGLTAGHRADGELLAPWHSYKVYLAECNNLDPEEFYGPDYEEFVLTDNAYTNWTIIRTVDTESDTAGPKAYEDLAIDPEREDITNMKVTIQDLDFDTRYVAVVVGVDKAGNEGTALTWAVGDTIKFSVTQGLMMASADMPSDGFDGLIDEGDFKEASALYWTAAQREVTNGVEVGFEVVRRYELLYWDSPKFQERLENPWQSVAGGVQSNWFVDVGYNDIADNNNLRFYRASYENRWQRTNPVSLKPQRPLVSEEVYALNTLKLTEGFNFVALHGVPHTPTLRGIFGTSDEFWPSLSTISALNVTLDWYVNGSSTNSGGAIYSTDNYFLSEGVWYKADGSATDYSDVELDPAALNSGFSITLPPATLWPAGVKIEENGVHYLLWNPILQVPTNQATLINPIQGGGSVATPVYTLAGYTLPTTAHPSEMGLLESGFRGMPANRRGYADQIFAVDPTTGSLRAGASAVYYCVDNGGSWRFVSNNGLVPSNYFHPNDLVMFVSKSGGPDWVWTNRIPYDLPTRWMEPATKVTP